VDQGRRPEERDAELDRRHRRGSEGTRTIRQCLGGFSECSVKLHPLLSYYGPPNPPWRRILVIGHEPDTDERMGTHAGPYDLAAGKPTSFWILSHKAVGRASGFGEYLRAAAIACGNSPIVYSDASPAS